jgi:hypothetical protein
MGIKREWYVCMLFSYFAVPYSELKGQFLVSYIDLVLIDQQSMGKRSLHLMDTVNEKKRWTTIYGRVNNFLKKCYRGTPC